MHSEVYWFKLDNNFPTVRCLFHMPCVLLLITIFYFNKMCENLSYQSFLRGPNWHRISFNINYILLKCVRKNVINKLDMIFLHCSSFNLMSKTSLDLNMPLGKAVCEMHSKIYCCLVLHWKTSRFQISTFYVHFFFIFYIYRKTRFVRQKMLHIRGIHLNILD